jgi:type IV secretion system protein VirB10
MAQTPDNVFVPLDGPAADGLGRTGIPGNEDDHTFQRFGGAVLLALSSNVASVLSAALSKSGSTYLNINTGDLTSLASEILRDTVNIPPTITVWQGTDVAIWIRYPIDFSASYRLRPINAAQ